MKQLPGWAYALMLSTLLGLLFWAWILIDEPLDPEIREILEPSRQERQGFSQADRIAELFTADPKDDWTAIYYFLGIDAPPDDDPVETGKRVFNARLQHDRQPEEELDTLEAAGCATDDLACWRELPSARQWLADFYQNTQHIFERLDALGSAYPSRLPSNTAMPLAAQQNRLQQKQKLRSVHLVVDGSTDAQNQEIRRLRLAIDRHRDLLLRIEGELYKVIVIRDLEKILNQLLWLLHHGQNDIDWAAMPNSEFKLLPNDTAYRRNFTERTLRDLDQALQFGGFFVKPNLSLNQAKRCAEWAIQILNREILLEGDTRDWKDCPHLRYHPGNHRGHLYLETATFSQSGIACTAHRLNERLTLAGDLIAASSRLSAKDSTSLQPAGSNLNPAIYFDREQACRNSALDAVCHDTTCVQSPFDPSKMPAPADSD